MSKREKLIQYLAALPAAMRFSDVQKVLEWHGYELDRANGSHFIFVDILPTAKAGGF